MELAERIGARVRTLRPAQSLTLDRLSERCGVPPEPISRIERGKATASLPTLDKLAAALGVGLGELIGEDAIEAADGFSPAVRGLALRLERADDATIEKARQIIEILLTKE